MLTITLSKEVENRLNEEATRSGLRAADLAAVLIEKSLPKPDEDNGATVAILRSWLEEDATNDPSELAEQAREGEEFMQNLARNRIEMEGPNARKLWP